MTYFEFLGRIACTLRISHVAWSMCLCVGYTGELCRNGWTDRDAVRRLTHVDPRNQLLDGFRSPLEGALLRETRAGLLSHNYAWRMCQPSALGGWMRSPPWGVTITAMRPFAKLLWTLVLSFSLTPMTYSRKAWYDFWRHCVVHNFRHF